MEIVKARLRKYTPMIAQCPVLELLEERDGLVLVSEENQEKVNQYILEIYQGAKDALEDLPLVGEVMEVEASLDHTLNLLGEVCSPCSVELTIVLKLAALRRDRLGAQVVGDIFTAIFGRKS